MTSILSVFYAILFISAIGFIIRSNFIFDHILDEVNTHRAPNEQIGPLFVNWRTGEIMDEHERLFPSDLKRRQMKISMYVGFALMGLMVIAVVVANLL
jgi:hypothetical protein